MKLFKGYRPNPPPEYYEKGCANEPEAVQYEGVVYSDGTTVIHWMTKFKSVSVFASYEDFYAVHGHPEYGTRIEWVQSEVNQ